MQWLRDKPKHDAELKKIKRLTTVSAVEDQINFIKSKLYTECLTELNHITEIPYETLKEQFDSERILIKEALQKEHSYITQEHDSGMPPSLYKDLNAIMVKEKINPKNMILKYAAENLDNPRIIMLSSATGGSLKYYPHFFIKPRITIHEPLFQQYKAFQHFTGWHELYHIFLRHTSMNEMTRPYTSNNNRLISIQEREADIHAASKNTHAARAGKEMNCIFGYPQIINRQSHCKEMEIMYALMQQKETISRQIQQKERLS